MVFIGLMARQAAPLMLQSAAHNGTALSVTDSAATGAALGAGAGKDDGAVAELQQLMGQPMRWRRRASTTPCSGG